MDDEIFNRTIRVDVLKVSTNFVDEYNHLSS